MLAGVVVTLVDLGALALLVQWVGLTPRQANLPSLILGSMVQFFSHRHLVFLGALKGQFSRQASLFVVSEILGVGLNAVIFHVMVEWMSISYIAVRPICAALVYFGFSFPLWRWIFRVDPSALTE